MDISRICRYITEETSLAPDRVKSVLELLARGSTIPFIARYRKEATGSLDEVQIKSISDGLGHYAGLEARKDEILRMIGASGKLSEKIRADIGACRDHQTLEDIYLPYQKKEKTRAMLAREKGLSPLASLILDEQPSAGNRDEIIKKFINEPAGITSSETALKEAIEIVIEEIAENAAVRKALRDFYMERGILISKVRRELDGAKTKYESYYNFAEAIATIPSHRLLAIRRGGRERVLAWNIDLREDEAVALIRRKIGVNEKSIFTKELLRSVMASYRRTLAGAIEVEVFRARSSIAESEATEIFAKNLRQLLLAPPTPGRIILGMDPGIATGCKCAVIDGSGGLKDYFTIFLHIPHLLKEAERAVLDNLASGKVELIAVGNGTGSKEAFSFLRDALKRAQVKIPVMLVSEAGASVYSASDAARREFASLDITFRGAVNIARRLQNPLAELIKIDPKSISIGQYQHDVNQTELKKSLDLVVESCVDLVGADLNTASAELLQYISGIGPELARRIVAHRGLKGAFRNKRELLNVEGVGEKVFEQCAGFLKIPDGEDPLDATTIHPESYHIVERMARELSSTVPGLVGNTKLIDRIEPERFVDGIIGLPTIDDILYELEKPGQDPRAEFSAVEFSSIINDIRDLHPGMVLNGVVTNVTAFGAFVDIGIHQDGLIHISRMSKKFVSDPHLFISVGDRAEVKVVAVDKALDRISLELSKISFRANTGALHDTIEGMGKR